MTAHGVKLDTLKDCLQFLMWLHQSDDKQGEVARELHDRLSGRYLNPNQQHIKSALSEFLIAVSKFHNKLCNKANQKHISSNPNDALNAILECIPKFLAVMYFLRYQVDEGFKALGGGGWADKPVGSAIFGGELQAYFTAPSSSKTYGVVPGGFGRLELKSYYRRGSFMTGYLATICEKHADRNIQNYFLDVFATSVLRENSGTQDSNTANALALVRTFCEIVEKETQAGGGELKQKLDDSLNGDTVKKMEVKNLKKEEFAKYTAQWLRENLATVKTNLGNIDTTNKALGKKSAAELTDYFTNNLFPYGFTFDKYNFARHKNPYDVLQESWANVINEFNKANNGLAKLKEILEGQKCPGDEGKKLEGAQNQGPQNGPADPASQNNGRSEAKHPPSPVAKSGDPGVQGSQGFPGGTVTPGPSQSPDASSKQVVHPQQPAMLPPATPPPPPAAPLPGSTGPAGQPGDRGQGSHGDVTPSIKPGVPQYKGPPQILSASGQGPGPTGGQGAGSTGSGGAVQDVSGVATAPGATGPGGGGGGRVTGGEPIDIEEIVMINVAKPPVVDVDESVASEFYKRDMFDADGGALLYNYDGAPVSGHEYRDESRLDGTKVQNNYELLMHQQEAKEALEAQQNLYEQQLRKVSLAGIPTIDSKGILNSMPPQTLANNELLIGHPITAPGRQITTPPLHKFLAIDGQYIVDPSAKHPRLPALPILKLLPSPKPAEPYPPALTQREHALIMQGISVSGSKNLSRIPSIRVSSDLRDLNPSVLEPTGESVLHRGQMSNTPTSRSAAPSPPTKIYPPAIGQLDDQFSSSIPDVEGAPIKNKPYQIPTAYIPQDSTFETFVPPEPTGVPILYTKTKPSRKSLTPVEIDDHPGIMIDEPICPLHSRVSVTEKVPPTDSSIPPPRTVREMLCWISDLTYALGYAALTQQIASFFDNSEIIAFPEPFSAGDVTEALSQTCGHASSVLAAVEGPKPAAPNKSHYQRYGVPLMHYSDDPCTLLCQLLNYVYAALHQLLFLRTMCVRDTHSGGWRDCQFGIAVKASEAWQCRKDPVDPMQGQDHGCDASPLQGFLTDQSVLPTYWYHRGDICRRSRVRMGFRPDHLRRESKHGFYIYQILKGLCYNADPLEKLCTYLNCITRRTPRTTGELVSFFYNFGNELHDAPSRLSPLGSALSTAHDDCPGWDRLGEEDLRAIKDARGSDASTVNHDKDQGHPKTLSTLLGCGIDNAKCPQLMMPITYRAYALYSPSFAHTYLSWAAYLADRLWESLLKLHYDLENLQCHDSKPLHQCDKALPLLYKHGITPPDGTLQSSLSCSKLVAKLEEVVAGQPIADLMTAMDNFLYGIRAPFLYTITALWSIATLYIAHSFLYRMDVLRIRSHLLTTRASHLIDVKALLSTSRRMLSLYKDVDYFDDDFHS
ncbi:ribosome binding protein [Babesia ovata]|uniref:Ribosome binding protein n=1 Tax=Babesia ovata TaxID=189622 RepID=A0A2H6KG42_9APIC|nr:ribosome binding protein [Babesia ovata]GBE61947.1 ribosome binding protein [Babesia ovata]